MRSQRGLRRFDFTIGDERYKIGMVRHPLAALRLQHRRDLARLAGERAVDRRGAGSSASSSRRRCCGIWSAARGPRSGHSCIRNPRRAPAGMKSLVRLALISDIHANLDALEATVADITSAIGQSHCLSRRYRRIQHQAVRMHCAASGASMPCASPATTISPCADGSPAGISATRPRGHRRGRAGGCPGAIWISSAACRSKPMSMASLFAVHGALHPETGCESVRARQRRERRLLSFGALMAHPSGARICAFGHTHHLGVYEFADGQVALGGRDAGDRAAGRRLLSDKSRHRGANRAAMDRRASYMVLDLARRTVTVPSRRV